MQNFEIHTYLIECLSNLHVGSGDNNYGIIDKEVQKDPISKLPIIHASGLKGALREYFEQYFPSQGAFTNEVIAHIFGTDKGEGGKMLQGNYRFFEAQMLVIPIRGKGNIPFYHATSKQMLELFNNHSKNLGIDVSVKYTEGTDNTDSEYKGKNAIEKDTNFLGENLLILSNKEMEDAAEYLPIIARNKLNNGQSENLWYEQIVPRESRFYFFVAVPKGDTHFIQNFNANLHNKVVQIGANATVGYGYCKISKIS